MEEFFSQILSANFNFFNLPTLLDILSWVNSTIIKFLTFTLHRSMITDGTIQLFYARENVDYN